MTGIADPVAVAAFNGQWHKVLALVMHKLNVQEVLITKEDVAAVQDGDLILLAGEQSDGFHLQMLSGAAARTAESLMAMPSRGRA